MTDTMTPEQIAAAEAQVAAFKAYAAANPQHFEQPAPAPAQPAPLSEAEYSKAVISAISQPEYKTDPDYRAEVAQGIAEEQAARAAAATAAPESPAALPQGGDYFRSAYELREAIKNPRYREDAAWRADVARKVANAAAAGIDLN